MAAVLLQQAAAALQASAGLLEAQETGIIVKALSQFLTHAVRAGIAARSSAPVLCVLPLC